MGIVVHTSYTAKIELRIPCLVHCENCGCQFVYERQFSGEGKAGTVNPFGHDRAERAAESRAHGDLNKMLSNEEINDPIPCPQCLHYQPYMFSQVRYAHYDNMGCLCYSLIAVGLVVLVGALGYAAIWNAAPLAFVLAVFGGVTWLVGWLVERRMHKLVLQYEPNDEEAVREDSDRRTHIAKHRAIRLPEYDAQQAARVGRECELAHASADGSSRQDQLMVEWWLPPSVFNHGGTVSIMLPDGKRFMATVSDDANPGDVVNAAPTNPDAEPLRLRLHAMRVHPDESGQDS